MRLGLVARFGRLGERSYAYVDLFAAAAAAIQALDAFSAHSVAKHRARCQLKKCANRLRVCTHLGSNTKPAAPTVMRPAVCTPPFPRSHPSTSTPAFIFTVLSAAKAVDVLSSKIVHKVVEPSYQRSLSSEKSLLAIDPPSWSLPEPFLPAASSRTSFVEQGDTNSGRSTSSRLVT